MRGTIGRALMTAIVLMFTGCASISEQFQGMTHHDPGYSTEFIAGNSDNVLIDFAHGSDQELDAAHTLAVNRCALFGRTGAKLESINPRDEGRDRASYLCQ